MRQKPDWIALSAMLLTLIVHLATMHRGPSTLFIASACVFWVGFIVYRAWRDREVLREWGFRRENLKEASLICLGLFVVGMIGFAIIALNQDSLQFPIHTPILLVIYSIWGLIQELLVLGIVVLNLNRLRFFQQRQPLLVIVGATIFGLVHAYDLRLVPVTVVLELIVIPLYLKYRNLWPFGLLHGWLGTFFYLWVLNRDLWKEHILS
mgnify:CR=1 FL=1